mmetsp:Transcript_48936/g.57157  ORF Transcript_48936/g.57157 Transcript_48936/m.57157 type:complete len:143 (+) Transcript_48936:251-679(+)
MDPVDISLTLESMVAMDGLCHQCPTDGIHQLVRFEKWTFVGAGCTALFGRERCFRKSRERKLEGGAGLRVMELGIRRDGIAAASTMALDNCAGHLCAGRWILQNGGIDGTESVGRQRPAPRSSGFSAYQGRYRTFLSAVSAR